VEFLKILNKTLRYWFYGTRPYIAVHYLFLTGFGIFLGSNIFTEPIYLTKSIGIGLAIFFAFQTSLVFNDINDTKADELSKKLTPPISGDISITAYQNLGIFFFIFSLIFAILIDYRILRVILIIHLLHFSYSLKPFRLKRFYPLSIAILAVGALLAVIAGYSIYQPDKPFSSFPLRPAMFIIIPLFLGLNFRDLADYQGDKKTETTTLFTLFGLERGRIINAILMFITYLSVPVTLNYPILFFITIPLGGISMYYCLKRPFEEKYIFYIYFILIGIFAILFNLNPGIVVGTDKFSSKDGVVSGFIPEITHYVVSGLIPENTFTPLRGYTTLSLVSHRASRPRLRRGLRAHSSGW